MKKVKNPLPVSQKYYERLQARIRRIFRELVLGTAEEANDFAYTVMTGHAREAAPEVYGLDDVQTIIYVTLRKEIRTAVERSRKARERAIKRATLIRREKEEARKRAEHEARMEERRARRRAEREPERKENEKAECPVSGHSAGEIVAGIPTQPACDAQGKETKDYSSACAFSAYSLRSFS